MPKTSRNPAHRSNIYIYALADPLTHEIRYIGQAAELESRIKQHMSMRDKGNPAKNEWLKGLMSQGLEPDILILQEAYGQTAYLIERLWINAMFHAGQPLTNIQLIDTKDRPVYDPIAYGIPTEEQIEIARQTWQRYFDSVTKQQPEAL